MASPSLPALLPSRKPQTSHKQAERNMQRTTGNLQGAIVAIARMEGELQSSSDK